MIETRTLFDQLRFRAGDPVYPLGSEIDLQLIAACIDLLHRKILSQDEEIEKLRKELDQPFL